MATNPTHPESSSDWPRRSGAMSEEAFRELERLNPDRKYEYINGVAYMMSGGTTAHDLIVDNVRSSLRSRLRSSSGSCHSFGDNMQVLVEVKKSGKKQYLYPDASVSCSVEDRRLDNTLIKFPRVVVEVLSPGTEAKDRGVKFRAYQKCPTIQEIVLLSQFAPSVEVWQRDEQNTELWHRHLYVRGETVEFASIGLRVTIEELYQDLDFMLEDLGEEDEE